MFHLARLTAVFNPASGEEAITLVRAGVDKLMEMPTESLTLPSEERAYVSSPWGATVPTGNAKKTLTLVLLCEYLTVAQLEANIRARELQLAACRHGTLELHEAYHQGVPAMRTRWQACCVAMDVRKILPQDDALGRRYAQPTLMGKANGEITYTWHLWKPEQF